MAILPLIFMATLGAILVLAPLASVSQIAGIGLGRGYDYLKMMTAAFEAGVHIPILLAILFAAALIFGALSVFVLPRLRGGIGYDIFGIAMSASAFIVGVAQAAWVGTTGASAGGFSILLIVFGLFFCALHTAVLVLRLKFIGSLPIRL